MVVEPEELLEELDDELLELEEELLDELEVDELVDDDDELELLLEDELDEPVLVQPVPCGLLPVTLR